VLGRTPGRLGSSRDLLMGEANLATGFASQDGDRTAILAQAVDLILIADFKTLKQERRLAPRAVELADIHSNLQLLDIDNDFHA
jgi:hypothetical protein